MADVGDYNINVYNKQGTLLDTLTFSTTNETIGSVLQSSICINNGITALSNSVGGTELDSDLNLYRMPTGVVYPNLYDVTPEIVATPIIGFMHNGTEYVFHDPQTDGIEELLAAI